MDSPLVALQLFSTTFSTFWNDNLIPNLFLFVFLMSSDLSAFHKHYVVVAKPLQSYAKINEYKNYQLDMTLCLFVLIRIIVCMWVDS